MRSGAGERGRLEAVIRKRSEIACLVRFFSGRRHEFEKKDNRCVCIIQVAIFRIKSLFLFYLRPFSYARKKKDQKEARPSAGGRFFRELTPDSKKRIGWPANGLQQCQYQCDGRISTEKPPIPPVAGCEMHDWARPAFLPLSFRREGRGERSAGTWGDAQTGIRL